MKTILILIAGMADLPDPLTLRETPLTMGQIPALDTLARRGEITSFPTISDRHQISYMNALLSIMGYDLDRGQPSLEEMMEFGLDNSIPLTEYSTLRPFVIPGFSGHGVCITTSAWARGAAKCALIKPLDIYSPGSSDSEILEAMAKLTTESVTGNEFVMVYVDTPLKASLRGDYEGKIRSLETIDRHLIAPIADFVWKSDLFINLAITTDLVTTWHRQRPTKMGVPLILYFNNHDWDGDPGRSFTEVESMLSERNFNHPSDLIRYLTSFSVTDEEDSEQPY